MAGWLFADLTLLLFVIFLPSDVSGDDIKKEESNSAVATTTTTTVAQPLEPRGVIPNPIEILVNISGNPPTKDEVIATLEDGLSRSEVSRNIKFGVIQVLAGIQGKDSIEARDDASKRANTIENVLIEIARTDSSSETRLKPWLYTLSGSDKSLEYPTVKLRLFPDNE